MNATEERTTVDLLAKRQESTNRWLEHISNKLGDRPLFWTIRSGVAWGIIWAIIIIAVFQTMLFAVGYMILESKIAAKQTADASGPAFDPPAHDPEPSKAVVETRKMQLRQWIKDGEVGPVSGSLAPEVCKIEREYISKHPDEADQCFAELLSRFQSIRQAMMADGLVPIAYP